MNETVLYQGSKRPITAGTQLANLAPVKAETRNKIDPIYVLYVLVVEASKTKTQAIYISSRNLYTECQDPRMHSYKLLEA